MKLFNFFFGRGKKPSVKASYDAAQTTRNNQNHWAAANYTSADGDANAYERKILRMRSRYEVANNSYASGLVQMLANDTIGTGPRLQFDLDDEAECEKIEKAFNAWALSIDLMAKMRTAKIDRIQSGEAFAILCQNPKVDNPVKLDIMLVDADRVTGDFTVLDQTDRIVDGIEFDQYGNPVVYNVLKHHPNDPYSSSVDSMKVNAKYMLHIFDCRRSGQHRGIPELAAALPQFAQLRRYNLAVLSAAEAAADFAAVLYTDSPANAEAADVAPLESIELERNMLTTIPAGWKLGQMDSKHPSAAHAEFVKLNLTEIARCVCATYGTISGDYSGYNYASGRLDNQIYHKSIFVDRATWERKFLNPILRAFLREYALVNKVAMPLDEHTWFWDGFPHVDPSKNAAANERNIASNTTTIMEICANDGRDGMAILKQRAKEVKFMRENNIPFEDTAQAQPQQKQQNTKQEEGEEDE